MVLLLPDLALTNATPVRKSAAIRASSRPHGFHITVMSNYLKLSAVLLVLTLATEDITLHLTGITRRHSLLSLVGPTNH